LGKIKIKTKIFFYPLSAIAQVAKHNQAKFRALANMGDILIKMNNLEEAVKVCASLTTLDLIPRSVRLCGI
jgi:hypothetical protein